MGLTCVKAEQIQQDPLDVLQELKSSLHIKIGAQVYRMDVLQRQGKAYKASNDVERAQECATLILTHKQLKTKYVQMHTNVSKLLIAIQESADSIDVLKGYKVGNETLHTLLSRVDLDEVDEVLDQLGEHFDQSNEIQQALSREIVMVDEVGEVGEVDIILKKSTKATSNATQKPQESQKILA